MPTNKFGTLLPVFVFLRPAFITLLTIESNKKAKKGQEKWRTNQKLCALHQLIWRLFAQISLLGK
jgi:hypothetical protein